MFKYYKLVALIPFRIAFVFAVILSLTHNGSHYKSEWATDDGFVLTVFLTLMISVLVSILSMSILLNKIRAVKENRWLRFLSWFLLPGIVCLNFIFKEILNFTGFNNIDGVYQGSRLLDGYILLIAVAHLSFLVIGFVRFRGRIDESFKDN